MSETRDWAILMEKTILLWRWGASAWWRHGGACFLRRLFHIWLVTEDLWRNKWGKMQSVGMWTQILHIFSVRRNKQSFVSLTPLCFVDAVAPPLPPGGAQHCSAASTTASRTRAHSAHGADGAHGTDGAHGAHGTSDLCKQRHRRHAEARRTDSVGECPRWFNW